MRKVYETSVSDSVGTITTRTKAEHPLIYHKPQPSRYQTQLAARPPDWLLRPLVLSTIA